MGAARGLAGGAGGVRLRRGGGAGAWGCGEWGAQGAWGCGEGRPKGRPAPARARCGARPGAARGGPGGVRVRRIRGAGRVRLGWAGLRLGAAPAGHVVPGAHGGGAAGRAGREGAGARRAVVFERTRYPPDAKGVRRPAVARLRPVPGPLGLLPHGREVVRRDARHLGEGHDGLARGELPPVEVLLPGCRAAPRAGGQGVGVSPLRPTSSRSRSANSLICGSSSSGRAFQRDMVFFPSPCVSPGVCLLVPRRGRPPARASRPVRRRAGPGPAAGRPRACVEPDVRS